MNKEESGILEKYDRNGRTVSLVSLVFLFLISILVWWFINQSVIKVHFLEMGNFSSLQVAVLIGLFLINAVWYLVSYLNNQRMTRANHELVMAAEKLLQYKKALDGVSDHVVITDIDGKIIYVNRAAEKLTGYQEPEMLGQRPSLWGKQMDLAFYKNFWRTIKEDKMPFVGELKNKRKSGEVYDAEIHVSPILNNRNEVIFFVGIERDVTKLKAIDKMKTEFISLASHQLRTPLSAVKWFGRMLADGDAGKLTTTQLEYLEKINESTEREIQLVNSLLNISRIESGRIVVEPKMTDIEQLVRQIVDDLSPNFVKQRKIKLNIEGTLAPINVDPDLVRHVYLNLIGNAIRYTEDNGLVEINLNLKGSDLLTTVKDNGIGISDKDKDRIFEKFFRSGNAIRKETDGSGLGLYIAKSIVESSGGNIWFESRLGEGTSFFFTIPLAGMTRKEGEATLS